jgi:hypothetical protein
MAHLTGDFCPYDSFDDYSTMFGSAISDPNVLVKEKPPAPLTDAELDEMIRKKRGASSLRSQLNALEKKYGVDSIPAGDRRVWQAAMTDAWIDQVSLYAKDWQKEVDAARKEAEECKNCGRKTRLQAHVKRLEKEDPRKDAVERFEAEHGVTMEELRGHPMYMPRGEDETTLHPIALMVKRYREAHPLVDGPPVDDEETKAEPSEDGGSPTAKTEDEPPTAKTESEAKTRDESPAEEEVPKSRSWFSALSPF